MINISRYNEISDNDNSDFNIRKIRTDVPFPTENDYKVGYIQRYFIQKRNAEDSYVYEVTRQYYSDISINPFFTGVIVKWKISGKREEVREMNRKSVNYVSKDMKNLSLYLPNYLQFHKERV